MNCAFSKLKNRALALVGAAMLSACVSPTTAFPRHVLVEQLLKPRDGYTGLTNRACETWSDTDGSCMSYKILEYKFENEATRQELNKLGFICNLAGKRYKICLDKPGLCRIHYEKRCFLGIFCTKRERMEEYLPASSSYSLFINGGLVCANPSLYPVETY